MKVDLISGEVVDAAFGIHVGIGPGLNEAIYESLLHRELDRRGLLVERQKSVTFEYDGMIFVDGFRVDLLVENAVVVEVKSVERFAPVHRRQLLTYVRMLRLNVGLLLNFGSPLFKDGVVRVVDRFTTTAAPLPRGGRVRT